MWGRGRWAGVAGLALLAACDRGESSPVAPASAVPQAVAETLTAPIEPSPSASASPTPSDTASATPAPAAPLKPLATFPPRDECGKLPGFTAFRNAVFAATAKRDGEALVALADPDVRLDFGGGAGRDELRKRLADPKAPLWGEIVALAPLGCADDGTVATMPAIFSRVPDDVDPGRTMLVTGSDVPLRARPSPSAPEVRKLDWALVTLKGDGFDPAARYAEVDAADSSTGFVANTKLRSILDYRLVADKGADGAYRITALIVGD